MLENINGVPFPFTPIVVEKNEVGIKVRVCCREYDFGNEMFPVSIKALGKEILASPIRLVGKDNGVDAVWQDKENWVQERDDRHIVIMSAMQSRFAVISAVITIEYDGYICYKLRLATRSETDRCGFDEMPDMSERIVDMLHLEIPLKKECAAVCHYSKFGSDKDPYYSGVTKDEKKGFFPHSWYGNDDMGLGIYFDSDEHWNAADENNVCESITKEDVYMLRYHFLDGQPRRWQYEKKARRCVNRGISYTPVSFSFALQATPVKPMDEKLLLSEHIVHIDCFNHVDTDYYTFLMSPVSENDSTIILDRLKEKGVTTVTLHERWNRVQGWWKLGEEDGKNIHALIDEAHKRGMKIMFYFCNTLSILRPVEDEYFERNGVVSLDGLPLISYYRTPPQRTLRTCAKGTELFDDFTEGMVEFIKQYDPDGIYIDSASIPWACTNEKHGCGYTDEKGKRHPTYPINNMHRAFMKIYEEIHEKLGKTIQIHPWSAFIPTFLGFGDLYWAGEAVALKCGTDTEAIVNALDEGMFRAEFSGKNIGVPCQFLAYNLPDDSWNFKTATSLCAPFGIYPRPIDAFSTLDYMSQIWEVLDSFDAKECKFTPYYTGNSGGMCDNDRIRISSYEKKDTFVLVMTNPTSEDLKDVKVTSKYPAECELLSKKEVSGTAFEVDMPAYETLFVKCKK